jgi:hypothetical protein
MEELNKELAERVDAVFAWGGLDPHMKFIRGAVLDALTAYGNSHSEDVDKSEAISFDWLNDFIFNATDLMQNLSCLYEAHKNQQSYYLRYWGMEE